MHQYDVHRESIEPGRKARVTAEIPDALVHLQEDFLDQIFEIVGGAGHPKDEARNVVTVSLEQPAERVGIAALATRYEFRDVVHGRDFSRRTRAMPEGTPAVPEQDRGP